MNEKRIFAVRDSDQSPLRCHTLNINENDENENLGMGSININFNQNSKNPAQIIKL